MRITQVRLTQEGVFNDNKARLIAITPLFGYENGVKGSQVGYNFMCLAEKNDWGKVSVKVENLNPPITAEQLSASKDPIYVTFTDFVGKFYFSDRTKNYEMTCKASRVQIVKPTSI